MKTMKSLLMILCIASFGFMFQSCSQNDGKLQQDVVSRLDQMNANVSATVKDGVATLNGSVSSIEMRNRAEQLAREVKGIKSVVNNVEVTRTETPATTNNDQTIMTTLTDKLRNANISNVNIEVTNGEIILTGDVSRSDLTKIMQLANESNARRVTNRLNIK